MDKSRLWARRDNRRGLIPPPRHTRGRPLTTRRQQNDRPSAYPNVPLSKGGGAGRRTGLEVASRIASYLDARVVRGTDGRPRCDAEEITQQWAGDVWLEVGRTVDPRLVEGSDWKLLAYALDRASRAGYDVQQHLPRLAARELLPEHQPARALHYRRVQECEPAITPRSHPAALAKQNEAARVRLAEEAQRRDNQQALRRSTETTPGTHSQPPKTPTTPARPAVPATPPRERGPQR